MSHFEEELRREHIDFFYVFEKFIFGNIINRFLAKMEYLSDDVIENYKTCGLEKLSKELQFEIWKVHIINLLEEDSNKSELHSILNFFNFLIYENRVLNEHVKRKFIEEPEYSFYDEINQSDFEEKKNSTDVTLIVNDTKLYVNYHALAEGSPVFKRRLESLGDKDLVLELPWKNIKEVLLFLTFLTKPVRFNGELILFLHNLVDF